MNILATVLGIGVKVLDWFGVRKEKREQFIKFMQAMQHTAYGPVELAKETARQLSNLKKRRDERIAASTAPKPEVKP